MKMDYGLRPNTDSESETYQQIVRKVIATFDDAEQSYFRLNPGEIGKNPKIAKAVLMERIVYRVIELRIARKTWNAIHTDLMVNFGIELSTSTLRRWCEKAL